MNNNPNISSHKYKDVNIQARTPMFHAMQDISKNDVVCFTDSGVIPLRTQESFLNSQGLKTNADRDYKKGEIVKHDHLSFDQVTQEKNNIKKLFGVLPKVSGPNKTKIQRLIQKKIKGVVEFNG